MMEDNIKLEKGFIAVSLDGVLAEYTRWKGQEDIGEPIQPMIDRVKNWIDRGIKVKIFTPRIAPIGRHTDGTRQDMSKIKIAIQKWSVRHIGHRLDIIYEEVPSAFLFLSHRAVRVEKNTGKIMDVSEESIEEEIKRRIH